jgi:hypothetical protein
VCPYCGLSDPLKSHAEAATSAKNETQSEALSENSSSQEKSKPSIQHESAHDVSLPAKSVNDLVISEDHKEI